MVICVNVILQVGKGGQIFFLMPALLCPTCNNFLKVKKAGFFVELSVNYFYTLILYLLSKFYSYSKKLT